jgi:hypothetical protein
MNPPAAHATSTAAAPPTASAVLSETAAPPPPVAGAPLGTADGWVAGAVAALVGLLVLYSSDSLLLEEPAAEDIEDELPELDFGGLHGGGVTQVEVDEVAAAEGFAVATALEPVCEVIPGMSADIELPGAMFMPGIALLLDEEEPELPDEEDPELLDEEEPELPDEEEPELPDFGGVHGGGVTQVDVDDPEEFEPVANDEEDVAAELGLTEAAGVAEAVAGATVVVGNTRGAPAGGAPAGGAPAPAVDEVESLPDFRPISDSTTARSTIATSAPMTQAVLFGLSLSGPG